MINLLLQGQVEIFIMIMIAVVISLSFHEFGHAWTAKYFGDNTAERMGRLTINPIAHIDPMGLLMVAFIGFGYAKPVPTDPRNFNSHMASLWVSAAGPGMNLVLAFLAINLQVLGANGQIEILGGAGPQIFLSYMAFINLILMLFNLLPIGPLDGHYILPYFLSRDNAIKYLRWNEQYGTMLLMGLVLLSIVGVPIFSFLMRLAQNISRFLIVF
ncbi:MAG: site-2 protease family protein [Kangiellaceae bacterium]|nr:site-2 protease family protein [Kangiellaceae bacterium]MCW9018519.1 site-2 protease family protein [Kangiellaceae bacterium]